MDNGLNLKDDCIKQDKFEIYIVYRRLQTIGGCPIVEGLHFYSTLRVILIYEK